MSLLEPRTALTTPSGSIVTAGRILGSGGQGEVYEADFQGRRHALKWYYSDWVQNDRDLWSRLERLIKKGPPAPNFVWPEALVGQRGNSTTFGYLMPLVDMSRFRSLRELDTRSVTPRLSLLATLGTNIAQTFWSLQAKGLCYRDISKDNVLFDPSNGNVCVVDNDNVDVHGTSAIIGGTPEFMAPELVRQDLGAETNRHTDMHSLAVLLFSILHIHHPLEGRRKLGIRIWDTAAIKEMYGFNPIFIFDPKDKRNAALPRDPRSDPEGEAGANALAFWDIYPRFLKQHFTQCFTEGLRDPSRRIAVPTWRAAMSELRDSVIYCGTCGEENFCDGGNVVGGNCFACKRAVAMPFRLTVNNRTVMLNADTVLYAHHVDRQRRFDFSEIVARMKQHPQHAHIWGLHNTSRLQWTASRPNGERVDVAPGMSLVIERGVRVNFGSDDAVVI